MIRYLRLAMVLAVLLIGGILVACSDGDGGGASTATIEETVPGGDETPSDASETPTGDNATDGGSGSFEGLPVPDGAQQSQSGTFTADQIPFVAPDFDAGAYSNIEWRTYDVPGDAESTLAFYDAELGNWHEVFKLDSGLGAFGVWTRNDGDEALWVGFTDIGEGTELILIHGTAN